MTLDTRLITNAQAAASRLGIPAQFFAAWWISENGREWPADNNVGNISYSGKGIPSGGVFTGVTAVQDNEVCTYATDVDGVNAFCELLAIPKGPDKVLTLDVSDLLALGGDIDAMARAVGNSNWAESHYEECDPTGSPLPGSYPGKLIFDVYHSPDVAQAFANAAPAADPAPVVDNSVDTVENYRRVHYVQEGDTLGALALKYGVPVLAMQVINNIPDPDKISIGERVGIPEAYRVQPGDTVSAIAAHYGDDVERIARANAINPDYIEVGWVLYV